MDNVAIECLSCKPLLHMDMLEAIRRGNADIIYAAPEGVLIKEKYSGAYMLSETDEALGRKLLDSLDKPGLLAVHQESLKDYAYSCFGYKEVIECFQAVYTRRERPEVANKVQIRRPSKEELLIIKKNYNKISDKEFYRINELGNLYAGISNGEMIGFVGSQLEGTMGLLEVLPQYRRQGYGSQLEKHMICIMLDKGYVPFAQIESYNESSLAMQKKLGLQISKGKLYWLINM